MDWESMTAPCGRDCFNCPAYVAKEHGRLRSFLAKKMDLPLEQASCNGCRDECGTIGFLKMKEPCKIFTCVQEKQITFCFECDDFPCDYLHPYADQASVIPHNTKVFNLCLIKKMGLESWAKTKAKSVFDTYFKAKFKI